MTIKSKTVKKIEEIVGEELTFGSMLRSERECRELTQTEFGNLLGVGKAYVCDIEKGRKKVTVHQAVKFASILGLSELVFAQLALQEEVQGLDLEIKVSKKSAS